MKKSLGKSDSICADMAELADAHGSGPCRSNSVEVRILLSAPHSKVSKNRDLVLFFDSDRVSAPKSGYLGSFLSYLISFQDLTTFSAINRLYKPINITKCSYILWRLEIHVNYLA